VQRKVRKSQQGIALVIVLWVMMILMVTVLSFSLLTRADTYGTLAFRDGLEKQFLAEAGIERGIAEMVYRSVNFGQTITLPGQEIWKTDGSSYHGRIGNGGYEVRIFDETGKISLNSLTDISGIVVKNLLVQLGSAPEEADTIVDSILDWKDADDLHRLHGAENDYYLSLPNPYRARNADFESLEELSLVKGITPDILFGTEVRKGLMRFLTVNGKVNTVNLNAASREVLAALPGMNAEMAEQILQIRKVKEIRGMEDVMNIIGGSYALLAPFISAQAGPAQTFTIEASGYKDVEARGYPIRATVIMDGPHKYRYVYYQSPAERLL
jgi:general secretion pathway protein K